MAAKKVKGLRVECKRDSFWRAGRKWTKEPQEIALDDLEKGQEKQLRNEAMLIVTDCEIEVGGKTDGGQGGEFDIEAAIAAIGKLGPKDEKAFTNGGKPDATVLADMLDTKVTAKQRDAAWTEFQRRQEGGDK